MKLFRRSQKIKKPSRLEGFSVGMARFELATSWSQTRRDDRTTLHPDSCYFKQAEGEGFEPSVPLRVRQFSKLLVSATHPSLRLKAEQ